MPVSLTDLLSLLSFTTPTAIGIAEGRKAGVIGISIGLAVGAGIGIAGFFGVRGLIKRIAQHPKIGTATSGLWLFLAWLIFFPLFMCPMLLGFLAAFITSRIIHFATT